MTINGRRSISIALVLCAISSLGVHHAYARRAFAIGYPIFTGQAVCFAADYANTFAGIAFFPTASTACQGGIFSPGYMVPLQVDTTGTKTVALTTKVTGTGQMSCALMEHSATGALVQTVQYNAFPVGNYTTSSKSITIAAGDTLSVLCAFGSTAPNVDQARMLMVSF